MQIKVSFRVFDYREIYQIKNIYSKFRKCSIFLKKDLDLMDVIAAMLKITLKLLQTVCT